ncbi:MAG: acetyl-CoA carboxylase biotin carboxyl carrier protein [Micromonosporaceae bacterium]
MYLTNEDVRDILDLLDALPFGELHLRTENFELHLRRTPGGEWTQSTQVLAEPSLLSPAVPSVSAASSAPSASSTPPPSGVAVAHGDGLAEVRSPLPGTFYRAPKPGAPPFVEVGSDVGEDTVVAIIETMKLMNSVASGTRGRVAEICLADAEFAGQDAVLMRIEPS